MNPTGVRKSFWLIGISVLFAGVVAIYQATQFSVLEEGDDASDTSAAARRRHGRDGFGNGDRRGRGAGDRTNVATVHAGDGYRRHDWGAESELQRMMSLRLPTPEFWRDPGTLERNQDDPQMIAMWRSFHEQRESESEDPSLPFEPTAHRLTLVNSEGEVGANPSSCDVRVLPVASGGFNCVIRVMCDGEVLYPDASQNAGYVRCEMGDDGRIVRAVDDGNTSGDGDPLVDYDLEGGTITVEDYSPEGERRYRATLRIQS